MRIFTISYLLLFIITSCLEIESKSPTLRYLALGDSYTIGEGVDSSMRYPVLIADTLRELGFNMADPEIIAVTGWTTAALLDSLDRTELNEPYDIVSLLIGVNNQYRGMDIQIYRQEFSRLLNMAISFTGNHPRKVIVLSVPDWGVMPFAEGRNREIIAGEIDEYNRINEDISRSKDVFWLDVTGISRLAANDPLLVATDGLHPSGRMYSAWVKEAVPMLLSIMQND